MMMKPVMKEVIVMMGLIVLVIQVFADEGMDHVKLV